MMEHLVKITITDNEGKTFSKEWKDTDDKRGAIERTLNHGDLQYCLDIANITSITADKFKRKYEPVKYD